MFLDITVTPEQMDAYGHHNAAIQHAIDTVSNQRGGKVILTAGTYILRGPLLMKSDVTLIGAGNKTILKAVPFVSSPLLEDADVGQKEIHPESAEGFLPGSGVVLMHKKPGSPSMAKRPLVLQHVQDGVLYTHGFIESDWWAVHDAVVINYFPHILCSEVHNVQIKNVFIDQKRENDAIALERDIWGGGIYCWRCEHITIERVKVYHAYGDGLRSGQSRHIHWLNCEVSHCTHYGVHPGSHTRPVKINDCDIHHNGSDGLYVCWGVKESEFCRNKIHHNGFRIHRNGFCIGHKDTDARVEDNHIYENAKHGIHIREKTEANGAHRGVYCNNVIENNGCDWNDVPQKLKDAVEHTSLEGTGIYINGITHDLRFEQNTIRNSNGKQKRGIYIGAGVINASFEENTVEGHETDIADVTEHVSQEV